MSRLIFVLIAILSSITQAAEVAELYQSRTPISNHSDEERQQATARILQEVLLKVVGSPTMLASKDLRPLLAQAEGFVSQYAYQRNLTTVGDSQQHLVLKFNESELNQAIAAIGLPVWGSRRPDTLVWLIVDEGGEQIIVSSGEENKQLFQLIMQTSEQRGLPIYLPLMDIQDQQELKDLKSAMTLSKDSPLMQASERYAAEIVVLAKVIKKQEQVWVDWQWLKGDQLQRHQSSGKMAEALASGINELADTLANELAIADKHDIKKRDYQLVVSDINNFTDYSRVQSYLHGLGMVSKVNIISLKDKQLDLKLRLALGLTAFNQAISDDGLLIQKNPQQNANIIHYRLRP